MSVSPPPEAYCSYQYWEQRLGRPADLPVMFHDLGQAMGWLPDDAAIRVAEVVANHPAQRQPSHAVDWVRGMFGSLGPLALTALETHVDGRDGTAESRALAGTLSRELRAEESARRLGLPSAASEGPAAMQVPEPFDLEIEHLQGWVSRISLGREVLEERGLSPGLVADCDGTLWAGDVGDAFYMRALRERRLRPQARAPLRELLASYGLDDYDDPHENAQALSEAFTSRRLHRLGERRGMSPREVTRDYYAAQTWVFAGHTVAQLKAWAWELFEGGFRRQVFRGVPALIAAAQRVGVPTYPVSASSQWLVDVGAAILGVPAWRARGVRTAVAAGIVDHHLEEPMTFGPGKVESLAGLIGGQPLLAIGDSPRQTDRELLECAHTRWVVNPSDEDRVFVRERYGQRWRTLRLSP